MSEPFRSPPDTNPQRHLPVRSNNTMGWALGAVAAAALVGLALYGLSGPRSSNRTSTVANPPAVLTSPAPTTNMPAPAPAETTTGQTVPRAQ